jgi:3-deoxy-7-phosphoheptulonate synthase
MISGGVSDLHAAPQWRLNNVLSKQVREEYETVVEKIIDGLNFYETIHAQAESTKSVSLFSSHEGLILDYEEALTRRVNGRGRNYNLGAHFLWIGDRTRQLDGAHIEYFRGIENPIGVKIGPSTKPEQLAAMIQLLNPRREPGRLTLITRYGVDAIEKILPTHIQAAKATNTPVVCIFERPSALVI